MSVKYLYFSLTLLCVFSNSALANTMEDFPVPPQAKVWWITKGNIHNGHEVFIKKFKSSQPAEHITKFYKNTWQTNNDMPGYMENSKGDWQLISRLNAEYQWVVQIRSSDSGRGSEGLLSAMRLNNKATARSVSMLSRSQFTESVQGGNLLSSTEASEPVLARTQLHLYPDRPSRVANQFKSHMTSRGWSIQDESLHQGTMTQRFEKSMRKIDVALVKHNGTKTLVFFNEVISNDN